MAHRHRAKKSEDWGWGMCVAPHKCRGDQQAHGGIERREKCSCGAVRKVEMNGGKRVAGEWVERLS